MTLSYVVLCPLFLFFNFLVVFFEFRNFVYYVVYSTECFYIKTFIT